MTKLSISKAWDETSAFIGRETRLLVPIALALLFLPPVIGSFLAPRATPQEMARPGIALAVLFAQLLIGAVGQIAISRLALGHRERLGDSLAHAVRRLPAFLGGFVILAFPLMILLGAAAGLAPAMAAKGNAVGGLIFSLLSFAFLILLMIVFARCTLNTAIAAVEPGGPIVVLKRGFALTKGQALRLFAAAMLILLGGAIATYAVTIVVGSLATLALGPPAPWTVPALLIAVAGSAVQAALIVVFTVLFARLYAQRAVEIGAPNSGI